jgi:hypothetical protein
MRHLGEVMRSIPLNRIDDGAVTQIERGHFRLQDRRGQGQNVVAQLAGRLQRRLAADPGTAAGPGRPAMGRVSVSPVTTRTCSRDTDRGRPRSGR